MDRSKTDLLRPVPSAESSSQGIPAAVLAAAADFVGAQADEILGGPGAATSLGLRDQLRGGHCDETPLVPKGKFHAAQHEIPLSQQNDELQQDQQQEIPDLHGDSGAELPDLTSDDRHHDDACKPRPSCWVAFY